MSFFFILYQMRKLAETGGLTPGLKAVFVVLLIPAFVCLVSRIVLLVSDLFDRRGKL